MTHAPALVQVGLTIGRWLLPLVAVVFVSATLAYAMNGAIPGKRSTTSPSAGPADLGPLPTPKRCPPIDGPYVDTLILTESRSLDCG